MITHTIYADESRQQGGNRERFMMYGMLIVPVGVVEEAFLQSVAEFRERRKIRFEFKWHKVSPAMGEAYAAYTELFWAHPEIRFCCLAVDTHQIRYEQYHDNDKETAFYNFYLMALSRNLELENRYQVLTDERSNRKNFRLPELKQRLNEYGVERGAKQALVRSLEARDSKTTEPLQMVDMLLGAVGYALEEYTTNAGKLAVVKGMETKLGLPSPDISSLKQYRGRGSRFNVWVFDFTKVKETSEVTNGVTNHSESRPNS